MEIFYKIGPITILDDGDGIFERDADPIGYRDKDGMNRGLSRKLVDSEEVKGILKEMGIGDLNGVRLGALEDYGAAHDRIKTFKKRAKVLTKEALAKEFKALSKELVSAADKARIDVGEGSAFQAMMEGLKAYVEKKSSPASYMDQSPLRVGIDPYIRLFFGPREGKSDSSESDESVEGTEAKGEEYDPDPILKSYEESDKESEWFSPGIFLFPHSYTF